MKKKDILLVCHAGSLSGLGHLSRLIALAQNLSQIDCIKIEFLIFGEDYHNKELDFFKVHRYPVYSDIEKSLKIPILEVDSPLPESDSSEPIE